MIEIQATMSQRAIELLNLPDDEPRFILDVGCGSGLSGEELTDAGHYWVGLDISPHMLDVAVERESEGDLFLQDMGQGLSFRAGTFDGVISVSALQWLCNADKKEHVPHKRLLKFFSTLYAAMARGARAVFQFYPQDPEQMEMITAAAMRAGFTGGLVVDYPNSTKAKKIFLCLFAGIVGELPRALGDGDNEEDAPKSVAFTAARRDYSKRDGNRLHPKSKQWIKEKKDRRRKQGKEVQEDSKYTGRKRKIRF
eukprot:Opistho-2@4436